MNTVTPAPPLCWGKKFTPEQITALHKLRLKFSWTYNQLNYLIACMAFETGGTFNPQIKNYAGSGAIGLIQFMPTTAKGLGTTTQQLSSMTFVQQLLYVEKHFAPYYKRVKTLSDMYMAILRPRSIGSAEDSTLFTDSLAYRLNLGLDANKDGKITKSEAAAKVKRYYERGMQFTNSTPGGYNEVESNVNVDSAGITGSLHNQPD